ncbi:MAG: hypothetical protein M3015_06085 [Bacteroidota bacterium]|nr:hypothetical protein [Bacteroidota bacterium]
MAPLYLCPSLTGYLFQLKFKTKMQDLPLSIIVIPGIAVLVDILLFTILLQKTNQKKIYYRYVFAIIIIAFLLNAAWEILQIPLYKGGAYQWDHILFCVLASVADVIMVLLIYLGFAFIYKNALWIKNFSASRIIILILTGGIGAVVAETRHLSIGTWSYADTMPLIPFFKVGLSPVLQFMVLPFFIYLLSFKMVTRYYHITK